MRASLISLGVAACLSLSACDAKEEAAAPPPKKDLGRPDQAYAGEEKLTSILVGSIERGDRPGEVVLKATAMAPSAGYTRPYFLPYIYPATPPDGIYKVDVLAMKPTTPNPAAPTEMKIEGVWNKYSDDRVRGVKFVTQTNELVAMLPPKEPPGAR